MTRSASKRSRAPGAGRRPGGRRRAGCRSGRRGGGHGDARRDRAPVDRDSRRDRHAPSRSGVRADQPPADRGHRSPALGRAGRGRAALRGAEQHRRVRAHGRGGQERGGPGRRLARKRDAREHRGDRSPRAGGPRRDLDGGDRAALRLVLRSGHLDGSRARSPTSWSASASSRSSATAAACGRSSTSPTPRRRRWRRSSAAAAGSTTSPTMIQHRLPSGCRRWPSSSAPGSRCACRDSSGVVRGRARRGADDRASRRFQCQGQARAGVASGAPELATGVRGGMTDRERLLEELRPLAFAIAYRMLGSVSEAEDVTQEALLRVHQALEAGEQIASPRAFVATVATRLAINDLRSARTRREQLRRRVAAGADHHRRPRRSGPPRRDGRLAVAGDAGGPGEPVARAASRAAASRRVRLRVSGDRGDRRQERGQRAPARHPRQAPGPAAPATLSDDARAARRAGATVLRGRRARRSRRARGAARARRRADRRRRRQGPGGRAVSARAQPRCASCHRVGRPGRAASRGVAAPRRGQRRLGSAPARRTGSG